MKLNLKYVFLVLVFCVVGQLLMGFVAIAKPSNSSKEIITFNTTPKRAWIIVQEEKSKKIRGKCKTPCSLKLEANIGYNVVFTKPRFELKVFFLPNYESWPTIHNKVINLRSNKEVTQMIKDKARANYEHHLIKCSIENYRELKDHDAKPCYRPQPKLPSRISKSGLCNMVFDVDPSGKLINIISKCSEKVLVRESIRALKRWMYYPKIVNGIPVHQSGLNVSVQFKLSNGIGDKAPTE